MGEKGRHKLGIEDGCCRWVSYFSLQFILKRRIKKKDEIEKEGLKKRNREKIDTKVGQPIWMLKRSIICFI